jgi:adenosylcobinamide-GDP ribazoletransferase
MGRRALRCNIDAALRQSHGWALRAGTAGLRRGGSFRAVIRARLREEWVVFLLALQFLTRLPLPADVGWSPARMAATPRWHAGVGLLVGGATGAVFWAGAVLWPPVLAAILATAAGVVLTGAFHEDGLADACDGLGGGATRERALEIMRDSRIGSYGAIGLGLVLGSKVAALTAIGAVSPAVAALALVAGHSAGRGSSVVVIATGRYVRDHGTGKPVSDGIGAGGLAFALATGLGAVFLMSLAVPWVAVAGALVGLVMGHAVMRQWYERRIGGYTGDCLGATQQTSELGLYMGLLACL